MQPVPDVPADDQHQPVEPDPADQFLTYVEQRAGHKLIKSEQQFVRKFFGDGPVRIDTARHFHSFVIQCYDDWANRTALDELARIAVELGLYEPVPSPVDRVDTTDEPTGFHCCGDLYHKHELLQGGCFSCPNNAWPKRADGPR